MVLKGNNMFDYNFIAKENDFVSTFTKETGNKLYDKVFSGWTKPVKTGIEIDKNGPIRCYKNGVDITKPVDSVVIYDIGFKHKCKSVDFN